MNPPARVLVLGDCVAPGFEPVARTLAGWIESGQCERQDVRDAATAIGCIESEGWIPDIAIVVQHWPEEFAPSAVHRLLSLAPLTRWTCCLGPWCEGSGRTGLPWPLAICVSARMCGSRLAKVWSVRHGQEPALPLTGSRDETFAFDLPPLPAKSPPHQLRACVESPDRELRDCIRAICRRNGVGHITDAESDTAADIIICDVDPIDEARHPNWAPGQKPQRIFVTGSTCPQDFERLRKSGANVVSKLQLAGELTSLLNTL